MTDEERKQVERAVLRRAVGCDSEEVTEEFSGEDGTLIRRRVVKKTHPPDVAAAKLLIGESAVREIETLTDEELEAERQRILREIKEEEEGS